MPEVRRLPKGTLSGTLPPPRGPLSARPMGRSSQPPADADQDARAARILSAGGLVDGALEVAAAVAPDAPVERARDTLADLVEGARARIGGVGTGADALERLQLLNRYLFEEVGLSGDRDTYDDPRNSLLTDVLEQRRGLPLSLSIVLVDVGRAVGLPLDGVCFPAHFLTRFPGPPMRLIDAFDGGALLDEPACAALLRRVTGGAVVFEPRHLRASPRRAIMLRMLRNLQSAFIRGAEWSGASRASDLLVACSLDEAPALRDRGVLRLRLHRYPDAIEDLETYLERRPQAADRAKIDGLLSRARAMRWSLN